MHSMMQRHDLSSSLPIGNRLSSQTLGLHLKHCLAEHELLIYAGLKPKVSLQSKFYNSLKDNW